jgi:hypothetical protein
MEGKILAPSHITSKSLPGLRSEGVVRRCGIIPTSSGRDRLWIPQSGATALGGMKKSAFIGLAHTCGCALLTAFPPFADLKGLRRPNFYTPLVNWLWSRLSSSSALRAQPQRRQFVAAAARTPGLAGGEQFGPAPTIPCRSFSGKRIMSIWRVIHDKRNFALNA